MRRTYSQWQQNISMNNIVYMQALFMLAWLHALLEERRTYIPQVILENFEKFY